MCGAPAVCAPAAAGFTLSALQGELNRWDSKYYTQNGKDVLVYLTVLLLTLQFKYESSSAGL
jgi:hypothetical protein